MAGNQRKSVQYRTKRYLPVRVVSGSNPVGDTSFFQWLNVRSLAFAACVRKFYGKGGADGDVILTVDDGTTAKPAAQKLAIPTKVAVRDMLGRRLAAHLGLLCLRRTRMLSGHVGAQPLKTAEPAKQA